MATRQLYGAAEIHYTDAVGDVVHKLATPIMVNPEHGFASVTRRRRWASENIDGSVRETFVAGEAVHEISGRIRFEDDYDGLLRMLRAGIEDGVTYTYFPYGPSNPGIDCILVALPESGESDITIRPDPSRFGMGEYEVAVVLRALSGYDFGTIF